MARLPFNLKKTVSIVLLDVNRIHIAHQKWRLLTYTVMNGTFKPSLSVSGHFRRILTMQDTNPIMWLNPFV